MENTEKFTLRLSRELKLSLQQMADKENKSLSDYLRKHLEQHAGGESSSGITKGPDAAVGQKKWEESNPSSLQRTIILRKGEEKIVFSKLHLYLAVLPK